MRQCSDVAAQRRHSRHRAGVRRAAARLELRARGGRREAARARPLLPAHDLAAGDAAHRHHARGHRLLLAAVAQHLFSKRRRVQVHCGPGGRRDPAHGGGRRSRHQDHRKDPAAGHSAFADRGSVQPFGVHCARPRGRRMLDSVGGLQGAAARGAQRLGHGADHDPACGADRHGSRAVPAVSRLLALRRNHIGGNAARDRQVARRSVQFRAGRGDHAAGGGS